MDSRAVRRVRRVLFRARHAGVAVGTMTAVLAGACGAAWLPAPHALAAGSVVFSVEPTPSSVAAGVTHQVSVYVTPADAGMLSAQVTVNFPDQLRYESYEPGGTQFPLAAASMGNTVGSKAVTIVAAFNNVNKPGTAGTKYLMGKLAATAMTAGTGTVTLTAGDAQDTTEAHLTPVAVQNAQVTVTGGPTPNPNPNPSTNPGTPTPVTCTTPDAGFGQAKGSISVDGTGTYYVWARIKPTATANSFKLDVEGTGGQCGIVIGDSSSLTAGTWQWVNYAAAATGTPLKLDLATGAHNVTMTGTEDGLEVDKLLFTPDASCTPQGMGGCAGTGDPGAGADKSEPAVDISKPVSGDTLKGSVPIEGVAMDNVGVTKVELLVDGGVKMTNDSSSAAFTLDTTTLPDGTRTIAIKAYDAANNNATTAPVNVTVANGGNPNPVPNAPVITSLTAMPATLTAGGKTTIKWMTTNVVAGGCSLSSTSLSSAPANGEWISPALNASANYMLTCINAQDVSVSKSVSVVVNPAPGSSPNPTPTPTPTPTPKPAPAPKPTASGAAANRSRTVTSSTTGQTVANGSTAGPVSGNTTLDPTNVTNATKEKSITKVEYYDGTNLLQTDYTAPFALDTTQLKDGTYTITERTHYSDGSSSEVTQTLDVTNVSSKTKAAPKKGFNVWAFIIPLSVLAAGGAGLFLFLRSRNQSTAYDPYAAGVDTVPMDAAYPPTPGAYDTGAPDWQQGIAPVNPPSGGQVIAPTNDERKDNL